MRKVVFSFFIILLFTSCQLSNSVRTPQSIIEKVKEAYYTKIKLSTSNYNNIKKLSLELLNQCPSQDCVIVGVGRSPTPLLAFIDTLIPQKAFQLPLSSFRYNPEGTKILERIVKAKNLQHFLDEELEYTIKLGKVLEKKLFDHFDNFVESNELAGKRLIFIDISNQSIHSITKYFEKFLKSRKYNIQIKSIQFTAIRQAKNVKLSRELYNSHNVQNTVIEQNRLNYLFNIEHFDRYAANSRFDILEHDAPETIYKNSEKFNYLKNIIRAHQQKDKLLTSQFPGGDTLNCTKLTKSLL